MKRFLLSVILCGTVLHARAQTDSLVLPGPEIRSVKALIDAVLLNSPELETDIARVESSVAHASQAGILPPPDLKLMEENMPGFDPGRAMFQRIELMQVIPYPAKLSAEREIADMFTLHAGHDEAEYVGDLIARLKKQYAELWFVQQEEVLQAEELKLLGEIGAIASVRYSTGKTGQDEVLKVSLRRSEAVNDSLMLRQREQSLQAMLAGAARGIRVETAVVNEGLTVIPPIDTLLTEAREYRSMLLHDSLNILQQKAVAHRASLEYFPDLTLALQRVTAPADDFGGWSVAVGITLPFAPWSIAGIAAKRNEADALVRGAESQYSASLLMIESAIHDFSYQAAAAKKRMEQFRSALMPQSRQLLDISLAGYRTGVTDFRMVVEAEQMYLEQVRGYYAARLSYEEAVADLEHEVGTQFFFTER